MKVAIENVVENREVEFFSGCWIVFKNFLFREKYEGLGNGIEREIRYHRSRNVQNRALNVVTLKVFVIRERVCCGLGYLHQGLLNSADVERRRIDNLQEEILCCIHSISLKPYGNIVQSWPLTIWWIEINILAISG